ncbi:hypothetical protein HETIRDRAFT_406535 [Heterobasidion irregulare TC 32-1]|uniref:Ubiquitin-like protein n=1 Tax=Heterobasidion irregulare (strain TC 32-1) TaxID=747525 RepID=W4KKP8_HETIT|nr:uncharacterized protein HETIRDRAFT_406535 [Heterobasidion irregulare TC 32-1]ETW86423.1 hypothetical protein HETIRDRAFT_406535 [Heterobasidion irregulare TC 32-1]
MTESTPSEIQINVKGPSELKLQITISTDKTVRELKQAIADQSAVEADRQRLIYSGRVLKDDDQLAVYKIQSSHTIHMVKGVARNAGSSSTGPSAAPQPLPSMQTGQNPHDPLTQLNSHLGYGAMAGLNPFADMGLNPNDPNMLQTMMSSPEFMQQMSSVMSNPAVVDQIIASNPQLASMGPQVREVLQSDRFREIMSNPEMLRSMLQMTSMMRDAGLAPPDMFGGAPGGGFPAPGNPNAAGTPSGAGAGSAPGAAASPFGVPPNPFGGGDPAALLRMLGGAGAPGAAGAGGFNPFFGGAPAAPADTRSPEERFQVQLQQLQDMGFSNASQNVRALLATGGNVHSAIEYILGGGGL